MHSNIQRIEPLNHLTIIKRGPRAYISHLPDLYQGRATVYDRSRMTLRARHHAPEMARPSVDPAMNNNATMHTSSGGTSAVQDNDGYCMNHHHHQYYNYNGLRADGFTGSMYKYRTIYRWLSLLSMRLVRDRVAIIRALSFMQFPPPSLTRATYFPYFEKMTGNYIFWDLMSGNYIFWDLMSGNYIF